MHATMAVMTTDTSDLHLIALLGRVAARDGDGTRRPADAEAALRELYDLKIGRASGRERV